MLRSIIELWNSDGRQGLIQFAFSFALAAVSLAMVGWAGWRRPARRRGFNPIIPSETQRRR